MKPGFNKLASPLAACKALKLTVVEIPAHKPSITEHHHLAIKFRTGASWEVPIKMQTQTRASGSKRKGASRGSTKSNLGIQNTNPLRPLKS